MYLKKGKVGEKRLPLQHLVLGPSKTFNIQCIDRSVKWGLPGYHRLIDLFFLNYYNYDFCPPTVIYHQPATSQRQTSKVLGPFQFTNIPNGPPPTPQSTLHNQHNSRTSNIPIVTLSCLCKSKSANRITLILSQRKPTMPSQN